MLPVYGAYTIIKTSPKIFPNKTSFKIDEGNSKYNIKPLKVQSFSSKTSHMLQLEILKENGAWGNPAL